MRPGAYEFLRALYWALRRNRVVAFHMLGVLWCFVPNTVRLLLLRLICAKHRPIIAISLVEHMGDIVAAEPMARLARRQFPSGCICWITQSSYASLPNSYPEVDHVITVRCLTEWLLLRKLNVFSIVWDLHIDGRVCPLCRIPLVKPGAPNEHNYHEHGNLLEVQCVNAGLPKLNTSPVINPPPAAVTTVNRLSLPPSYIVIHCVSNDPDKHWPEAKWQQLIKEVLSAYEVFIVEVGTEAMVIREDGSRRLSLCGKSNILETAEIIRRADLFIGIDSGPAHLANAVGTFGVILLGANHRARSYLPFGGAYGTGELAEIVRSDRANAAELSVDAVLAAVMLRMGGFSPSKKRQCPSPSPG